MASRRSSPRPNALAIATGEFRGAFSSIAALLSAWRDGAGDAVGPMRRWAKRRARAAAEEELPRPDQSQKDQSQKDQSQKDQPQNDQPQKDQSHKEREGSERHRETKWETKDEVNADRAESEAEPSPAHEPTASSYDTHERITAMEERYRRVIRVLVKQLVKTRQQQALGTIDESEQGKRIRVLARALKAAQAERTELQRKLLAVENTLAATEIRQFDSDGVHRRALVLQEELEDARRRLASAERLAKRLGTLEAQFSWELVEDVDGSRDLSGDSLSGDDVE